MSLSHYAELFRSESREHIATINHLLLALEAEPAAREPVEGLFRAVHTIKGMSATLGYAPVAELAHEMENVLEHLRLARGATDDGLIELLFRSVDALEAEMEDAAAERASRGDAGPLVQALRVAAESFRAPRKRTASRRRANGKNGRTGGAAASRAAVAAPAVNGNGAAARVRLVVSREAPLPGVRAFLALQRARQLGDVRHLSPAEHTLQQADFGGTLEFVVHCGRAVEEIRELLLGVGELAALEVEPELTNGVAAAAGRLEPDAEVAVPGADEGSRDAARHVRVGADRLDALMDRVGELVILRDRLERVAATRQDPALSEPTEQASRLISELREEIMRIRMVPVGEVFDRFPRLVRDAARGLEKRVEFVVEGKEIELDRSLLDRIGDPLVHLLRNALDHGIEPPAERRSAGKPEQGRLRLVAARERTRVVIRVEDDGRGIDRVRLLEKAVAEGFLSADDAAELGDDAILRLLTLPGFSTAASVTDVSGRGVGLDVVTTRVRALGGTLEIASEPGRGTCFALRLPLTVGIVRALLVRLGDQTYAIPVAHVAETVEFPDTEIRATRGRRFAVLREEPVPLTRLAEVLRVGGAASGAERVSAVLLEVGEQWFGLEVDALLGQQEIVIKPFDATSCTLPVFAGATIEFDGRRGLKAATLFQPRS